MELVHPSHVMNRRVDASSLFTERLQRLHGSQGDFLDLPSLDDRFLLLESIKVVLRGLHTSTLEYIAVEDLDKLNVGTIRQSIGNGLGVGSLIFISTVILAAC